MMSLLQPTSISVPLRQTEDGAIRIGQSRVLLELVIRAFLRGNTPESIAESYPSLRIDEIYAVIAYYLQNKLDVDAYLQQVEHDAATIRQTIESSQPDLTQLRARLLKQMENKE